MRRQKADLCQVPDGVAPTVEASAPPISSLCGPEPLGASPRPGEKQGEAKVSSLGASSVAEKVRRERPEPAGRWAATSLVSHRLTHQGWGLRPAGQALSFAGEEPLE